MPSRVQGKRWCFTLNNYSNEEVTLVRNLGEHELIKYIVFGREQGESGTPHLQGFLICNRNASRSRISSLLPRAHIELTRGTSLQAADYCKKDGDFEEIGDIPVNNTTNPHIDSIIKWGDDFIADRGRAPTVSELAKEQPTALIRYPRLLQVLELRAPPPVLVEGTLKPWQQELYDHLETDPNDRAIDFYVDHEGGKGKSWFQAYYVSKFPEKTQILSMGKRDDLAYTIDTTKSVFLFNIPRGGMEFLSYAILEQLKDRMVFSPKYTSKMKILTTVPHVVVFCNEHPDMNKMSHDRYVLTDNYN